MEHLLHDRLRSWLPALALLSGIAGLVYETIWLRWFRLLFGSTAYAASATLCAFFAGLALGAYWFGRRVERSTNPLRLYAAIEVGAAATALIVPLAVSAYGPIYGWLYEHLAENRTTFVAVKFALSFFAIVPCATLLGGALPALAAAYVGDPSATSAAGSEPCMRSIRWARRWELRSVHCGCRKSLACPPRTR
jgi:spermidine synthase